MEGFPAALVIASRLDVAHDNNVLFRLVRTMGSDLQSVDRMVNVVPFRRVYCFERADEIDLFRQEMLRRPLVLQPLLHFGRGLGSCGACYSDEQWVVMVNQTHPKILSRLQMGLDMAKVGIQRGQSMELKFRFGKAIERVYKKHLKQKEQGEAKSSKNSCLAHFRFAEWEHADLTIRFHGYAARLGRSSMRKLDNLKMNWSFEDVGMHEMIWNQLEGQRFQKPHMAPVTEDDIRVALPAWTVNSVSPLENIGDAIPQHTYSYNQAGRLYESFRKKQRQRERPNHGSEKPVTGDAQRWHTEELEGAVGGLPPPYPATDFVMEHDFGADQAQGRRRYQDYESVQHPVALEYEPVRDRMHSGNSYGSYSGDYHHEGEQYANSPHYTSPFSDRHGQVQVDVHVNKPHYNLPSPQPPSLQSPVSPKEYPSHGSSNNENYYLNGLQKQDSDRLSHSTNADSGYHAEMDGVRSREGSYDLNEGYGQKYVNVRQDHDRIPLKNIQSSHTGLENPGFEMDSNDTDHALQKHKELVAKILQDQSEQFPVSQTSSKQWAPSNSRHGSGNADQRYSSSPRNVIMKDGPDQVSDTFI